MKEVSVLIIDENKPDRIKLINDLSKISEYSFNYLQVNNIDKAICASNNFKFDLIFIDTGLDEGNGYRFLLDSNKRVQRRSKIIHKSEYILGITGADLAILKRPSYFRKESSAFVTMNQLPDGAIAADI